MRFDDSEGLLWVTPARVSARSGSASTRDVAALLTGLQHSPGKYRQQPLLRAPAGAVALDFETADPTINTIGSSWAFAGQGKILGMAVAWKGFEAYYPVAHSEDNVDPVPVFNWLKHHFLRSDIKFVCANAAYDLGWARREIGMYPSGGACDVQFMAALLDEYKFSYSLEAIGQEYLKAGKITGALAEIEDKYGISHSEIMKHLAYLPGRIVGPYGQGDARLTCDIFHVLLPLLRAEGLIPVHELESDLIPMTVEMRRKGMRVDVSNAERVRDGIKLRRMPALQDEIKRLSGVFVEPWSSSTVEDALSSFGYVCDRTPKGLPKVNAAALSILAKTQPIAAHILALRKMDKSCSTFLEGHILRHNMYGRVHPEFNQLRSEREDDGSGYGTVTGRFSCTNPGLQQIPVRDPEWGPIVRSMFLPDDGELVASLDYSSQEPRLAVHFAYLAYQAALRRKDKAQAVTLRGIEEAVRQYNENPRVDYHQMVADLCGIARGDAKAINLGLAYGMGGAKLARSLGLPTQWMRIDYGKWTEITQEEIPLARSEGASCVEVAGKEAKKIIKRWENGTPFIRGLFKLCTDRAQERGYIETLLKRRCRFEMQGDSYGWTHKSLNRLCQSSAADQTKLGMLALWKEGICPTLTVHDELVFSSKSLEDAQKLVPYMRDAVKLVVPSIVDVKVGKTWGDIKK